MVAINALMRTLREPAMSSHNAQVVRSAICAYPGAPAGCRALPAQGEAGPLLALVSCRSLQDAAVCSLVSTLPHVLRRRCEDGKTWSAAALPGDERAAGRR